MSVYICMLFVPRKKRASHVEVTLIIIKWWNCVICVAQIGDLGFSTTFNSFLITKSQQAKGTISHFPPEVIDKIAKKVQKPTKSWDIWRYVFFRTSITKMENNITVNNDVDSYVVVQINEIYWFRPQHYFLISLTGNVFAVPTASSACLVGSDVILRIG